MRGNYLVALVIGVMGAAVGAAIWAGVTVATQYQIGWMAVGVGFLVGIGMRMGGGSGALYSCTGGALALLGCVAGNLLTVMAFLAKELEMGVMDVVMSFDYSQSFALLAETFQPMDALFYALAIYFGAKYSSLGEEGAMMDPGV